ncbi:MAG TPA: M15 family metallopeptidase [Acidimicrobiales bacterium]|nr:M15 family metallopeptidase [Acidimicrobiales bacterium]
MAHRGAPSGNGSPLFPLRVHRRGGCPVCRSEKGQVLPLVALALVLVGGACLVLARLGAVAVARARAVAAADAAALAGAVDGEHAARRVAEANGARVERFERVGRTDVRVRVAFGPAQGRARARRVEPAPPAASLGDLSPAVRTALDRAARLLGRPVPITSGFRSSAEQATLYARRAMLPYPVAPPGRSMHERGLAVDVPTAFLPTLLPVARAAGLCRPYPVSDPVHFELCAGRAGEASAGPRARTG